MHYKLDGHRAVLCESLGEWAEWFAVADRRVAETWIDDVRVSTVFLSLDHNAFPGRDPALFETMVFVEGEPTSVRRYFIWEEAEAGHALTVGEIGREMEEAQTGAEAALGALMKRWAAV
ncbi:hypothetical protein BER2_4363 [plant metagenome]|uniref:Uncharacterized protein n=1 Tax=plant metagenome TaxID=1297885 RepID=A0A484RAV0_9ZZZZ